ncbi:MBL fold metallo-hydrolase [Proteus mirabilis]|nr:MBL fold metallo-hydrolase [Proteus mirabilis]
MISVRVLKAKNGDCILLSWVHDGTKRNILVDGGKSSVYKTVVQKGELYKALKKLRDNGERVDKLILTHVDDDHIGGLIKGFETGELLTDLCDSIWFNSGRLIKRGFNAESISSNELYLERRNRKDGETGVKQGVTLEERITELGIWDEELIVSGHSIEFYGAKITVLSPTLEKLSKLLHKWEKEAPRSVTSASVKDYKVGIDELTKDDVFEGDTSIHNGSSIAFIFEYMSKNILLLGDAHDDVICDSLSEMVSSKGNEGSYEKTLKMDCVKLSHHGSKYNTSYDFLRLIECKNFIISTDGSLHGLPNKLTLARIIKTIDKPSLIFNYPQLINKIFTKEEQETLAGSGVVIKSCEEHLNV